MSVCVSIYLYIYIERETHTHTYVYMYIHSINTWIKMILRISLRSYFEVLPLRMDDSSKMLDADSTINASKLRCQAQGSGKQLPRRHLARDF